MSAEAVLELRDVTRRFGATTAVDALSLTVAPGEVFTLLGPSGCGKSTTLRIVAGLEAPLPDVSSLDADAGAPRRAPKESTSC